jgi:hypothetical protein
MEIHPEDKYDYLYATPDELNYHDVTKWKVMTLFNGHNSWHHYMTFNDKKLNLTTFETVTSGKEDALECIERSRKLDYYTSRGTRWKLVEIVERVWHKLELLKREETYL